MKGPAPMMRVLVTGGSGRLASHLFRLAPPGEFALRVFSRQPRPSGDTRDWAMGDLVTGAGLAEALSGMDAVLHLASDPSHPASDVTAARMLADAAHQAGIRHLLFLSIIGVDRIPYPYYRQKHAAEEIIAGHAVPWSILRAAQFHSFVDELLSRLARIPLVMPLPLGMRVQSVDDGEMAEHLLTALRTGPMGFLRDFAGPEILTLAEAAAPWRQARGIRRVVVPVPVPGATAAAFRSGGNTNPAADRGTITWADWLARHASSGPTR